MSPQEERPAPAVVQSSPQTEAGQALLFYLRRAMDAREFERDSILAVEREATNTTIERVKAAIFAVDVSGQTTRDELFAILAAEAAK